MATAASRAPIGGVRPTLVQYRQLEASYADMVGWAGSLYQLAEALQQQNDVLKDRNEALESALWRDAAAPRLHIVAPEGA